MAKKNDNSLIIGVIILALAFGLYKWRSRTTEVSVPPPSSPMTNTVRNTSEVQQPTIIDKSELNQQKAKEQDQRRVLLAAKERLGMKSMKIPQDAKGNYELPVEVSIKHLWCQAGDYDAIKGFVRDFDKKVFLLELASTTSLGEFSKPVRFTLGDLSKGFRHTFRLKMKANTNENIALSLCTDKAKMGRCSEYKPADFPKLDAIQSKTPDKPLKDDFIYVFHSLFVKNGELVGIGTLDYSNEYMKNLSAILKKDDFAMGAFEENWRTAKTVRSEGLVFNKGKVQLHMTRNDPKCDLR